VNRRTLFIAAGVVGALQIGFLASMIAGRAAILRNGQEVLLSVQPVDPRDLLRGDYVTIGYNISSVSTDLFAERPQDDRNGRDRTVFVRLRPGEDGIWEAVAARYDEKPEPAPAGGELDIRGIATSSWYDDAASINIAYGIERFYVPEGEGRAIEGNLRERAFTMTVAVASDGTAQIKSLHDGETMLYAEPLY
jgi:uncharacterized membrane-anchored protein